LSQALLLFGPRHKKPPAYTGVISPVPGTEIGEAKHHEHNLFIIFNVQTGKNFRNL
jgi:hypothetical protein